jgi:hypothetical protein
MNPKHTILIWVGILAIAGMCLYWFRSSSRPQEDMSDTSQAIQQEQRQTAQQVNALCSRYNAVPDWSQQLKKDNADFDTAIYTIEAQDALIRPDGRPVLLLASVCDIARQSDKYSVHFYASSDFTTGTPEHALHFILTCTQDHIQKILTHPQSIFDMSFGTQSFAVVANISEVRKVRLALTADGYTDVWEDVVIDMDLDPSFNVFHAKGDCLDLLFVGDYAPPAAEPNAPD